MSWNSHAAYVNLHLNLPFGNDLLQSTWALLQGDEVLKKLLMMLLLTLFCEFAVAAEEAQLLK